MTSVIGCSYCLTSECNRWIKEKEVNKRRKTISYCYWCKAKFLGQSSRPRLRISIICGRLIGYIVWTLLNQFTQNLISAEVQTRHQYSFNRSSGDSLCTGLRTTAPGWFSSREINWSLFPSIMQLHFRDRVIRSVHKRSEHRWSSFLVSGSARVMLCHDPLRALQLLLRTTGGFISEVLKMWLRAWRMRAMRKNRVGERENEVERKRWKWKKRDKDRQGVGCRDAAAENKTADNGFQNSDLLSNHMAEILACL